MQANDTARASDALYSIPPDLPRDGWVKAGMGFNAAGGDFDTFDSWSAQGGNYNAADCRDAWRSFKPGKGVGAGSLFGMARDHGWTEGNPSPRPAPALSRPIEQPRKSAPGMSPSEIFGRCALATNSHSYMMEKRAAGVPLNDLRVVPDGDALIIQGELMTGALVVPCMASDGTLSTLQFITPPDVAARLKAKGKPSKLNLPGCPVQGWHTVGELVPGGIVHIVEGIGQGWACWQANGAAAVVCFGAGNMGKVATALRQQDPAARLVVVPDRGKEEQAQAIAKEVQGLCVTMPEGEANNFDANDLGQRDGLDVLAALLESATEPPKPEPKVHPLARYVDIDAKAKPPRWVIPGFIGHGVTVIAGAHGVGKTTALLPLAMTAAGLHGADLMPRHWRHVVYITEDVEQASRILAGVTGHSSLCINLEALRERLHIVEAVRLDPAFVASVGATYREQFTRTVKGVEVLPLVVLDTKSAVLAIENENDNSEASAMMAALKQGFDRLPVWLIGHVAKANLSRNDALTSRGASAIEGDANQTMFLIREGEIRYAEQQRKEDEASLRDAIQLAWVAGNPLNRAGVKAKVRRKTSDVVAMVENLLNERWLYEVTVPTKVRIVNSKGAFFVNLTTEEHEAILSDGALPADKLEIPASWQKQAIPLVPAPNSAVGEVDHA